VALYERALEVEQCVSAFELGTMYEDGEGVPKSLDRAAEYYALARQNRHPEAYLALKRIGRLPED
jgi:TPR repeat protein